MTQSSRTARVNRGSGVRRPIDGLKDATGLSAVSMHDGAKLAAARGQRADAPCTRVYYPGYWSDPPSTGTPVVCV